MKKTTGGCLPTTNDLSSLQIRCAALNKEETKGTVYGITLDEEEFMRFTSENNGSPATMISLLLNRAVAKLYPDCTDSIRVTLTVD